jgi:hypothetical protein
MGAIPKTPKEFEDAAPEDEKGSPLDTEEMQNRLNDLMRWRRQARIAQADNRMEMAIDEDFYDGIQMESEDLKILLDRNQPPLVFNVIKNTINWILGLERKAKVDYRILPRKKIGAISAKTKTKVFKYIQDVSDGEFLRSEAFAECILAGLGWLEVGARDTGDEPIFMGSERWRNMWYDHLSTRSDYIDMRYVIREKWVDLDIATEMFPERAGHLRVLAENANSLYPYTPEDIIITDSASEFDLETEVDAMYGGGGDTARKRVKLIEMNYRMPARVKIMKARGNDTPYGALDGVIMRETHPDHQYLVRGGYFSLEETTMLVVRHAMWAGGFLLQDEMTPYNHNRFSFIPLFCYRRKRDNMPYGVIRDLRDPQADLNRRRSKSLILLTARSVIYEKGAVDDALKTYDEVQRPDGMVEVNPGKRFEIEEQRDLAMGHVELARDDERFIHTTSGVTEQNLGQTKKDLSGIAIESLQQQGSVTQGIFFDNYYHFFKLTGEIILSLIEQFKDQNEEIRITGDEQKDDFVEINKPTENGEIENNITAAKADFIVAKQDYRESIRMAMFNMLSELVMGLSKTMPQLALSLIDEVIDLMDDLPNKEEIVARIRKINNQHGSEDDMTPDQKAELEKNATMVAQKQQESEDLQRLLAELQAALIKGQAMKINADGQLVKLDAFLKALEVAGSVAASPQIVAAADALIQEAQKPGIQEKMPEVQPAPGEPVVPAGGPVLPGAVLPQGKTV